MNPTPSRPDPRPHPALIAVCVLIFIAQIGIGLNYSAARTVNVPWLDDWASTVNGAINTANGTVSMADFWWQHNQLRVVMPMAVVTLLTRINNWYGPSEVAITILGLFVSCAVGIVLVWHGRRRNWLLLPLVGGLALSLRQNISYYFGFQSCWTWLVAASFGAILVIITIKSRWLGLLLAILMTVWASVTYLSGFLLWVMLLPLLWVYGWRKFLHYAVWFAAGTALLALYLIDYTRKGFAEVDGVTVTLLDYARYVLTWLGSPLTPVASTAWATPSMLFGVVLIGGLALNGLYAYFVAGERRYALLWLTIAAFVVAVGGVTSIGRAVFIFYNPDQPLAAQYVTLSLWGWVALIALGVAVIAAVGRKPTATRREKALVYGNLGVFAALIGLVGAGYTQQNALPGLVPVQFYECMRQFPIQRDVSCLATLVFSWERPEFHNQIGELARHRLNTFADWDPPADAVNADPLKATLIAYRSPDFQTVNTTDYLIGGQLQPVVYQAPNGLLEQWISVPDGVRSAIYESAIWVDPNNPAQDAIFRLYVAPVGSGNKDWQRVFQGRYDLDKESAPRPFRVNLSAWRGQTVRLIYETALTDPAARIPWAMWVNPRIVTRP